VCIIIEIRINSSKCIIANMVTYDEVKQKLENAIMQILEDMAYKRIAFANKYMSAVQSFVKSILAELNNALNVKVHYNIDTYFAEIYHSASMAEIGEKAVKPVYNDETTTIDGRTVIPFDTFTFNPNMYSTYSKLFSDRLSKYTVMFRIAISQSPPEGDFEDVDYVYYIPSIFYSNVEFVHDLYQEIGAYGELPDFAEFTIFAVRPLKVRFVKGVFDYFRRDIDADSVYCDIGSGGIVKAYDEDKGEWKELAYKFVVIAWNHTSYPVEVVINGKPHKVSANSVAVYVYLTDIHLKATPIRIVETSV